MRRKKRRDWNTKHNEKKNSTQHTNEMHMCLVRSFCPNWIPAISWIFIMVLFRFCLARLHTIAYYFVAYACSEINIIFLWLLINSAMKSSRERITIECILSVEIFCSYASPVSWSYHAHFEISIIFIDKFVSEKYQQFP